MKIKNIILVVTLGLANVAQAEWCVENYSRKTSCRASSTTDSADAYCSVRILELNQEGEERQRIIGISASNGTGVPSFIGETIGMFTLGLSNNVRRDARKQRAIKDAKQALQDYIEINACL